jgi:hypothetical protein
MLGSYADADEALQDALLRAWRSFGTFADRAPLPHWLYRISATTCLKAPQRRGRQPVLTGEITYLQPYPDTALPDPAAVVEQNESVALAFIAALQCGGNPRCSMQMLLHMSSLLAARPAGSPAAAEAVSGLLHVADSCAVRERRHPPRPLGPSHIQWLLPAVDVN